MKYLSLGLCLSCTLLVSQPGVGSEVALPAGTAVSVRLADTIDSDHDPLGKQYAASVAAPVDITGGQTIAPGSPATVVLIHNNSGWLTLLKALTVNGRRFQVVSSAGSLIGPEQGSKADASAGMLGRIGIAPAPAPTSDHRVLLPPATQLRFLLVGTATAAHALPANPRPRRSARIDTSPVAPPAESLAAPQPKPGIAYLCRASDTSDRAVPTAYYVADVFRTSDNPTLVERRWHEFLVATYPYRFANNPHATIQCTRLNDPADRDARKKLEGELKSENAEIIETRWHYRLGPPPVPTRMPATSTVTSPKAPPVPPTAEPR